MADFSSTEKVNASWKHLFGILGTSNSSPGKNWYEETIAATHIITPQEIWSDTVPAATTRSQAVTNCGLIVENRSDSVTIVLTASGTDWDITTSIKPVVGLQVTNTHPSPTYIKSITNVVPRGGNNYTITLNNNTGVSAGPAVLHRRVFLTADPSSNGLAWFSRLEYGNTFSSQILNFIQPQKFGNGYTIRLFQANGTEVTTTQGAWIFNWQKGCLLFAKGYTPTDLSYQQPMYIEGFRYIGKFGVGDSITPGEIHDTLRFDGTQYVPNSTVKADGMNLGILNRLTVSGSIVVPSGTPPASSGVSGTIGEVRWDGNFLYLNTPVGWARTDLRYY
jgi:hypothetical protein